MKKLEWKRLNSKDAHFSTHFSALFTQQSFDPKLEKRVSQILHKVRTGGDQALCELTNQLDGRALRSAADFCVAQTAALQAFADLDARQRQALETAAERIRAFHIHQVQKSWKHQEADGTEFGERVDALERVGIYTPGGQACYPSSVLMNAIPAKLAGVQNITMMVPAPENTLNPLVLAAAHVAGVDQIFTLGGAQAIAALAFGTETITPVDKITGPGNAYVATAKRQVFGYCGIDMIAGPSEIVILADSSAPASWLAMDLFAQAEHDSKARALLISADAQVLDAVEEQAQRLLPQQPRKALIEKALAQQGALIQVGDLAEAVHLVNRIAPEHVELALKDAENLVMHIKHAGSIFVGSSTAEALGDYVLGANHVLPTQGTARFASALSVFDFQKRTQILQASPHGAAKLAATAATLATGEGLFAHAQAANYRRKPCP